MTDTKRFADRVVYLTGAASGIGAATARRFADEGAQLYLTDVAEEGLVATGATCTEAGATVVTEVCNVADEDQVMASVAACVERFGKLDVVANVAGIQRWYRTDEHPLDDFKLTLDINLVGTFLVCREALPHLLASRGSIVNTSSTTALAGIPYSAAYAASKAGVQALTKSLAVEYAKQGLQVNCVNPGSIRTPMSTMPPVEDIDFDLLLRQNSLAGQAEPEAVAGLIAFLASEDGRHVNGEFVRIDGAALA